jgi:hypothetical protein
MLIAPIITNVIMLQIKVILASLKYFVSNYNLHKKKVNKGQENT